jgi:phenol hydroxylase P1 protein
MNDEMWQPLRKLCEHSLTEQDWFKLYILQNLLIDTFLQELVFGQLDQWLVEHGGRDIAILTEFVKDCLTDLRKWSDSVLKTAISESEENKTLIQSWITEMLPNVQLAFQSWAQNAIPDSNIDTALNALSERSKKVGLVLLDSAA